MPKKNNDNDNDQLHVQVTPGDENADPGQYKDLTSLFRLLKLDSQHINQLLSEAKSSNILQNLQGQSRYPEMDLKFLEVVLQKLYLENEEKRSRIIAEKFEFFDKHNVPDIERRHWLEEMERMKTIGQGDESILRQLLMLSRLTNTIMDNGGLLTVVEDDDDNQE